VAVELFLALNGWALQVSDADAVVTLLAVADGDLDEGALAAWLRDHIAPRPPAQPALAHDVTGP
jgi:death-on-curing protein